MSGTDYHPIRSKPVAAILEGMAGHLDESPCGMIAARLANLRLGDNQHAEGSPIGLPSTHTQSEAAALLNVGTSTVKRAAWIDQISKAQLVL